MNFQRKGTSSYFEISGRNVFLYCPGHTAATFLFSDLFQKDGKPAVLVFYLGAFSEGSRPFLDSLIDNGSSYIFWTRSCKEDDFNDAPSMELKGDQLKRLENMGYYLEHFPVFVSSEIGTGNISFDPVRSALLIKVDGAYPFDFIAHAGDTGTSGGQFTEACIPLSHAPEPFAKKKTNVPDNFGSFCFLTVPSDKKLVQPAVPYMLKKAAEANPVFPDLFPKASFNQRVDSVVTFFPNKQVNNGITDVAGYAEFHIRDGKTIPTHVPGDKGKRMAARNLHTLTCTLTALEHGNGDAKRYGYFFIPAENASLEIEKLGQAKMLLGQSGTEAVETPGTSQTVYFISSSQVLIDVSDAASKDKYRLLESGRSRTVRIKLDDPAKKEPNAKEVQYFTDSQRAPLFRNYKSAGLGESAVPNAYDEVYQFQPGGHLDGLAIPFIPTLSVAGDPDLLLVEKALSAARLDMASQVKSKLFDAGTEFITPQGIQVKGDEYHLTKQVSGTSFRFFMKSSDPNLRTSLTKDEVFFVLTPELVRLAVSSMPAGFRIEALLDLEKFQVNFTQFYANLSPDGAPSTHEQCIIICKFNKQSLEHLLSDPGEWSNAGPLQVPADQLRAVRGGIKKSVDVCKGNAYFSKLLTDPSWNGVVVLNIPIQNKDADPVLEGLMSSQDHKEEEVPKLVLKSELVYNYIAFPSNKTKNSNGQVVVEETGLFGLIDYNPLRLREDYDKIYNYLSGLGGDQSDKYRFALTRLYVDFQNSSIAAFDSNVFVWASELFEDANIEFFENLVNSGERDQYHKEPIKKLIRLRGSYQKNGDGQPEFRFLLETDVVIKLNTSIIKEIRLYGASFTYVGAAAGNKRIFRFDFDAGMDFKDLAAQYFSFKALRLRNIGLKIELTGKKGLEAPKFDLSRLLVLPDISFDRKGLLGNFPIRFSGFKSYAIDAGKLLDFDFMPLLPKKFDGIPNSSLFSFIFDVDLGTLGALDGLKALNGQLLLGWHKGKNGSDGGFHIGFRLSGAETRFELDLFGAMKLTVEELKLGTFQMPDGNCNGYYIRMNEAKLELFGLKLPPKKNSFYGILMVAPDQGGEKKNKKIAWLVNYTKKPGSPDEHEMGELVLGIGQRTGVPLVIKPEVDPITGKPAGLVAAYIDKLKSTFTQDLSKLGDCAPLSAIPYNPDRNWLIASEAVMPKAWRKKVDLKFIFNDPVLYGVYLRILGLFEIDILYRKLSERLGLWSLEFALDPALRTVEMGGASVTFPNIGLDIYTNGNWKADIGFPRGTDYSRSCLVQVLPFVGWGGFYLMKSRTSSTTLFAGYISDEYAQKNELLILQAGLALRIGLGKYVSKGPLYIGASISVFGMLEGAFAFEGKQTGLKTFLPDHFALYGRVGIIAEVLGYVDFKIVKAAVHLILVVETGVKMVYLGYDVGSRRKGLQPILLYVEGRVSVAVRVKITCFKVWKKKICIYITFRFTTSIRFEFLLGGKGGSSKKLLESLKIADGVPLRIPVSIEDLPVCYLPDISCEGENIYWIHNFALPFFYFTKEGERFLAAKNNVLVKNILRPLFTSLVTNGITNYEAMRRVLIDDESIRGQVLLSFEKYRPVFYTGILHDDPQLLNKVFGFDLDEIKDFRDYNDQNNNACANTNSVETCLYRMISIPIVGQSAVQEKDAKPVPSEKLTITLKGLMDGVPDDHVLGNIPYEAKYLDDVEQLLGSFRTQFADRIEKQQKAYEDEANDLRRDLIVADYFKLVGLLALEEYMTSLEEKEREAVFTGKNPIPVEPMLAAATEGMETLIAQVNLYYSSGLRLPSRNKPGTAESYFRITEQASKVTLKAEPNYNDIELKINGVDIKPDMFEDAATFSEWFRSMREKTTTDPAVLKPQFGKLEVTQPFALRRYTVSLAEARFEVDQSNDRWYEVPEVLRTKMKDADSLTYQLFLGKHGNNYSEAAKATDKYEAPIPVPVAPIARLHASVRQLDPHCFEIGQAAAEDLLRAEAIRKVVKEKKSLQVYFQKEVTTADGRKKMVLEPAGSECWLVRTNLSNKTHPPIIVKTAKETAEKPVYQYLAPSSDAPLFARLLWESLATNHGGYFLVFAKPQEGHAGEENMVSISFSFALNASQPTAESNYLKVSLDPAIHESIAAGDQYLFLDNLKRQPADKEYIQEYYPSIPQHCMGFEQPRTLPNAEKDADAFEAYERNLSQYLPMEYSLEDAAGKTVIGRESVLPVMPQGADEAVQTYRHMTPLSAAAAGQPDRYKGVGKSFTIRTGIRDVFGFRAQGLGDTLSYRHLYFDKMVPVESWPLLKCTYWLDQKTAGGFQWKLTVKTDLESLYAHTGIKPGQDVKTLSADAWEAAVSATSSLLSQLYTVEAQVNDEKMNIAFTGGTGTDLRKFLAARIEEARVLLVQLQTLLQQEAGVLKPKIDANNTWTFKTSVQADALKTPLQFGIQLSRPAELCIGTTRPAVQGAGVWGYSDVVSAHTPIKLENPAVKGVGADADYTKSSLHRLSALIEGDKEFVLGVSAGADGQELYIINQKLLQVKPTDTRKTVPGDKLPADVKQIFTDRCYFGIRPFRNQLWSGSYRVQDGSGPLKQFTQIDQDAALRTVLEKIDELLAGTRIPNPALNGEDERLQQLLTGKKEVVHQVLAPLLDWVLEQGSVDAGTEEEFRNLLLEDLTHFYAFDGLIKTPVAPVPALEGHRLTLSIASVPNYNTVSSKLYFKTKDVAPEWSILFDQVDPLPLNFPVQAQVTHIEYGIEGIPGTEVEISRWIQLIKPVDLERIDVAKWPRIVRGFPPKPALIGQRAIQVYGNMPGQEPLKAWDIKKVGMWNAVLELEDHVEYVDTDRLYMELTVTKAKMLDALEKLYGFFAYWASEIIESKKPGKVFDRVAFIRDLYTVFTTAEKQMAEVAEAANEWFFQLKKVVDPVSKEHQWVVDKEGAQLTGKVKPRLKEGVPATGPANIKERRLLVHIGPFNLFAEPGKIITSVRSSVKAMRNIDVLNNGKGNAAFIYQTETVHAITPAVPQIRYTSPLPFQQDGKRTFKSEVLSSIPVSMAFKSTAKFLIGVGAANGGAPERPIRQYENAAGETLPDMDTLFNDFDLEEGKASISLTLMHESEAAPMFQADNIIRIVKP